MAQPSDSIYKPEFVRQLFNDMSSTYERMNTITSFGFSNRWRRRCVYELDIRPGETVVDLMTGMGETWGYIVREIGPTGTLVGVDFCENMLQYADRKRQKERYNPYAISIEQQDVLAGTLPAESAHHVVVAFGLKTFGERQIRQLAHEIKRILKPGGQFSLVEVSVPASFLLRTLYLFYLRYVIPILGALFLGNPQTYRMLGIYTIRFKHSQQAQQAFADAGLPCRKTSYFFGCATGIVGEKSNVYQ